MSKSQDKALSKDQNKRSRAPNYTEAEINLLIDLASKYKNVFQNTDTDAVTSREKNEAWIKLTNEFNSNGITYLRTTESLQGCYRTQKKKMKKRFSAAKMSIPVSSSAVGKKLLVDTVQEIGQNWEVVSETMGTTPQSCEATFKDMVSEMKTDERECKKDIIRTGGGGPARQPKEIYDKVKAIVGPALDGMFTIYDCDSDFMQEQQSLLPEEERQEPIEIANTILPEEDVIPEFSRKILKRKIDDSLEPPKKLTNRRRPQEKRNVSSYFIELGQKKMELVEIQTEMCQVDLQEKIKQSQHNDRIRAIELKIKEMELKALSKRIDESSNV